MKKESEGGRGTLQSPVLFFSRSVELPTACALGERNLNWGFRQVGAVYFCPPTKACHVWFKPTPAPVVHRMAVWAIVTSQPPAKKL